MIKQANDKIKINWWEWIPVIGVMAYLMRVDMWRGQQEKPLKKRMGKYRSIWNLTFMVIGLSFMIPFFVLRNTADFGPYPWMFWVAISSASINLSNPFVHKCLYKAGLKLYETWLKETKTDK